MQFVFSHMAVSESVMCAWSLMHNSGNIMLDSEATSTIWCLVVLLKVGLPLKRYMYRVEDVFS